MSATRRLSDWFLVPQPAEPLALLRIGLGLLVVVWTLALAGDASTFFGPDGLLPGAHGTTSPVAVLSWWTGPAAAPAVVAVVGLAGIALIVGWHTRLAALVVFVGLLSLQRRDPLVLNGGDLLLRIIALTVVAMPSGRVASLDARRAARRGRPSSPMASVWALRLAQIQVAVLYADSVWEKLAGETWRNGTAFGNAVRAEHLQRLVVPDWVLSNTALVALATWGTLAVEAAIPALVWNRRWRPWVLGAGVVLHLGIEVTMDLGFFPATILVSYLAFVPPETARHLLERVGLAGNDRPVDLDPHPPAPAPIAAPIAASSVGPETVQSAARSGPRAAIGPTPT